MTFFGVSYAVIAETNTQRAMCQRVSNFFSCNAILAATCTCTFISSWNTKESTVWFQMKKKNALHVGYYWLWKKIDVTDFFLIFKNCCMFHVPSYFWSKNSWSPKEYRFTDLSNNLFKVCLMPIHCAVFMRDLRIFSFSFYLDCIFKKFICYQNMLHVIIIC